MALARSCTEQNPFDPERFWGFFQSRFPTNIIRSKGLFWIASRPNQALIWGQAGGSIRTDSAGCGGGMPFASRTQFPSFIENQMDIEKTWDPHFGDRKTEIVIIGQDLDELHIRQELDACLVPAHLLDANWEEGYMDTWPVERVRPLS